MPLFFTSLRPLRSFALLALTMVLCSGPLRATASAALLQELHQRLDISSPGRARDVALTLDACGGAYDRALIATLVRLRVPATLFVTRRWLVRNPAALRELLAHPDLFELENHGAAHLPAVLGRSVYGMPGQPDIAAVVREVSEGARAVEQASGRSPHWYRGAGAIYDADSLQAVARLGFGTAGFSLNADAGATLPAAAVAKRLQRAAPGDIVIAHMNKPASGTAQGLAQALPQLLERDLHFVTLAQAAGVVRVQPGRP